MSEMPNAEPPETADRDEPSGPSRSASKLPILGIALLFYMMLGLLCLIAAAAIAFSLYAGR